MMVIMSISAVACGLCKYKENSLVSV